MAWELKEGQRAQTTPKLNYFAAKRARAVIEALQITSVGSVLADTNYAILMENRKTDAEVEIMFPYPDRGSDIWAVYSHETNDMAFYGTEELTEPRQGIELRRWIESKE